MLQRSAVRLCRIGGTVNTPLFRSNMISKSFKNSVESTGRNFIAVRNYCEQPTMIPEVNEDEISDKVRDVADRMLKLDYIALCQFMDLLKERTGIDPNALGDMGGGGGGAAGAGPAKAAEVVDTGFRKVIIREFTAGNLPVKEKFTIMKLMRAEQPDLSLADCKQRLDKAPCTIFDKIEKAKADDIVEQLKGMAISLVTVTV